MTPPDEPDDRDYSQRGSRRGEDRDTYTRRIRDERQDISDKVDTVVNLFAQLGYDLRNQNDINRLSENLRYTERQRRRYERFENNRFGWIVSFVCMAIGAMLTSFIPQWFNNKSGH